MSEKHDQKETDPRFYKDSSENPTSHLSVDISKKSVETSSDVSPNITTCI